MRNGYGRTPTTTSPAAGTSWRHRGRGTSYRILGSGIVATDRALADMAGVALVWDGAGTSFLLYPTGGAPTGTGTTAARLQAGTPPAPGDAMVAYEDQDGDAWTRRAGEFLDGRFEPVEDPTPP